MEVEVSRSLTKELPSDLSDEDRATKKVQNKAVESNEKVHGLSFRDTLIGNSEHSEDGVINKATNFVIEDVYAKLFNDDGVPAIVFSDRAHRLMAESMKNSVVVKLLGKFIDYCAL